MLMKLAKVRSRAWEEAAAYEVSGSLSFTGITAKSPPEPGMVAGTLQIRS